MAELRLVPARTLALLAGVLVAGVSPAVAQGAGNGFLFHTPSVTLTLHGGYDRAVAQSDIFDFTTKQLTLGQGDFSGLAGGGDLSFRLAPRVDVMLSAAYTGRVKPSEFRDWVGTDDLPIEQRTRFERAPVTANLKLYLLPRGRTIGSFAWVPAKVAPYIGAGGGAMWYRFRQQGDFVDYETLDIYNDFLQSDGWAPVAQALAGVDVSLTPRFALNGETRYAWSHARLGESFVDFDPIDLSGLSATVGLSIRF
jgi:hypothetical protein